MSSDTPIADQAAEVTGTVIAPASVMTGHQVDVLKPGELEQLLGVRVLPVREWALALVRNEEFEEQDAEENAFGIIRAIMLAQTSEQVFAAMDMVRSEDICSREPGARSSVLEIRSAFPLKSTFEDGPPCFMVVSVKDLAEGREFTFSCGARAVQAAVLAHIVSGWMPMKAALVRRRTPTRAGFYPLNLESGI